MNLMTLPSQSDPRLLNRLLDEQDVVLFGAKIAPYLGAISWLEKQSLDVQFSQAFHEMNMQGVTPLSPFLTTYLNQQHPNEFDIVIAEPNSGTPPKTGIVFLHGFGGNFTLQCWLIATAGDHIDALTVCPSTDQSGSWWNSQGQSIFEETFAFLHGRGVERIYLAGLSNGAIGASRLVDPYKNKIEGLILISGADPGATMTELPVLLLHGKYDERIPVSVMEQYASTAGPNAMYHLFEGDHFLLLKQADQVQEVMIDWLRVQELNSQ
jgi:pimeloyl-ACP methyl ester carboxylesterase